MLPPQLRDPIAAMPGLGNPAASIRSPGPNDINEDRAHVSRPAIDMESGSARHLRHGEPQQRRDLRGRSARARRRFEFDIDQNVGQQQTDRQYLNATMDTLRTLADNTDGRAIVNRNDLATGMKQIIARQQRVLPARLQLVARADRRQVPRDQGAGEAAGRAGARAQGLLGVHGRAMRKRALAPPKPEPPKAVETALAAIAAAHARVRDRAHLDRHRRAATNGKTQGHVRVGAGAATRRAIRRADRGTARARVR